MTTPVTVKEIRILLGFNQLSDEEVVAQCLANISGFTGNLNYQLLPVTLANFSAAVSQFQADITAAGDGSKKAIAAKKQATQAGHPDVETACRLRRNQQ
jgi:hypothetical protein